MIWAELQREQHAAYGSTLRVPGRPQYGHRPIVMRFAGRRWVLDDDAQSMIFTVSNRYHCRHEPGYGRAYARYVLLLAGKLRIDTTTAGRLARWMCPDGCTVLRTGPRVLHVLTREEEDRWRTAQLHRDHDRRVEALRTTAAAYLAEHGRNPAGPYTCEGCGSRRIDGNDWDFAQRRPYVSEGGVRRTCGPRCPGRQGTD